MPKPFNTSWPLVKAWPLALLGGVLSLSAWSQAERVFPSQLSKVSKDTPIFKEPSKSSEVLGDAPANTPILLRGYSPKKTWVLIEDEDGAEGWVPTKRVEIPMPDGQNEDGEPLPSPEAAKNGQKTAAPTAPPAPVPQFFQPAQTYDLLFVDRYEFKKNDHLNLLGAQLSLSLYKLVKSTTDRFSRSEISVGYLRTPTARNAWNLPLRYSFHTTSLSSLFIMGPDAGFTWTKRGDPGTEKYFGLGYFFGYKLTQFNNARVRVSYDLGKTSHFALEGGVQWMFF